MESLNRILVMVLVAQLIMGNGAIAWAQGIKERGERGKLPQFESKEGRAGASKTPGVISATPGEEPIPGGRALSRAVRPDQYVLGPGDGLTITLWGEYYDNEEYSVQISPDGKISLPTIGTLALNGLTLLRAEDLIGQEVRKRYSNVKSGVSLRSLRLFEVQVLGEVQKPGSYRATPVRRVSDLVEQAGGILAGGSRRYVQVMREGNVAAVADLHNYLLKGDELANPYLRDGDVIFVPRMAGWRVDVYITEVQSVGTNVAGPLSENLVPHTVELKRGERVYTAIEEVGGTNSWWDLEGVFVQREMIAPAGTMRIPVDLRQLIYENDESQNLELIAGDKVYIPAQVKRVFITGAVKLPGPYTYFPAKQVDSYVALAGGISPVADLEKSYIKRADGSVEPYANSAELQNGDSIIVLEKTFKTYQDYFTVLAGLAGVVLSVVGLYAAFTQFRR